MASYGDLFCLARKWRGLTQKQAASKLGLSQAKLSRLEADLTEPEPELIQKAADFFDVPPSFFYITDRIYGPPVSVHAMFRKAGSGVSAQNNERITAELNLKLIQLRRLLESIDYHPTYQIPDFPASEWGSLGERMGGDTVQDVAAKVRRYWQLPNGPIKNLVSVAEHAGIIISFSDFYGAAVSGVTLAAPGMPPLVLLNRSHLADRLRFTLAHEMGHLVMHPMPTATMEKEADAFASALLLPPDDMRQLFHKRRITLELLAQLKPIWRVSMAALVIAARQVGAVTANQERYLWQQISARGWRKREPAHLDSAIEQPQVLPRIIQAHIDELDFSLSELASLGYVNTKDFKAFYDLPDQDLTSQWASQWASQCPSQRAEKGPHKRRPHLRIVR